MPQDQSPWDDGAGFWRSGDGQRSDGRPSGSSNGDRGSRADRSSGSRAANNGRDEPRARHSPRAANGAGREGRGGRFSNTADDLRNRLGIRGSAAGRARPDADKRLPGEELWQDPAGRRRPAGSAAANGAGRRARAANGGQAGWDGGPTQAWQDPDAGRNGYRGTRRAGGRAAAGLGETGAGARNGRTAVRDRNAGPGELGWGGGEDQRGPASLRSRVSDLRGGRRGGGSGPGGPGGRDGGPGNYHGEPLSGGQRFKRWLLYGRWWRHWTWKKAVAVLGGGLAAFFLLGIIGVYILYRMTPIPDATTEVASWQSSNVYLVSGKLLGTFENSGQSRQLLTAAQIPAVMTEAMTAAEDRNFYTEGGISVSGLVRSAYDDLLGSGTLQGGSTITMQYAKNYYSGVNTGQNASTKIKEIFIAMKLAHEKSKPYIMTNYLNTVPFGPTEYGLGAAAEAYFNVDLTKPHAALTIGQAAMLASMPNAPGVFNPDPKAGADYLALVARWKYVLHNMLRDGNISQQQYNATVKAFPKLTPAANTNGWTGYKGYLMQMVEQEMEAPRSFGGYGLTDHQLHTGGYKITTTLSLAKVDALARSINAEKAAMDAQAAAGNGSRFPSYDRIGSVLENAKTGAIVAVYGGPGYGVKHCLRYSCQYNSAEAPEPVGSSFKPYVLSTAVNEYMSVFTSRLNGYSPIAIPVYPVTPTTEHMLSLLKPPPGASFGSIGFEYQDNRYFVFNEKSENMGPLAVNVAAARSSDAAFMDLAHRDGVDAIIQMAQQFGVGESPFNQNCPTGGTVQQMTACSDLTGKNELQQLFSTNTSICHAQTCGSPQITLGEGPLTAVEQATTFATLADDGVYHSPHVIAKVQQGTTVLPSDVITRIVLSPGAAADVDWALSFDNNYGLGTAQSNVPFRRGGVIGKTGTLGVDVNSSQAWFIGATPKQYALSVGLYTEEGNGTTQILNNLPYIGGTPGSQGGGWPATIWNNFMEAEFGTQSWVPVNQVFPTVNSYPFVPWIQVGAKKPASRMCKPGHHRNCTCPQGGQQCGNPNPNPNPGPTCGHGHGLQPCGNPSPTPTCGQFGQQPCFTPTPTPTPTPPVSPSPTCFPPGPCSTPSPGTIGAGEAASVRASPLTAAAAVVAAEDRAAVAGVPLLA